jgi:hypothetical protein
MMNEPTVTVQIVKFDNGNMTCNTMNGYTVKISNKAFNDYTILEKGDFVQIEVGYLPNELQKECLDYEDGYYN